MRSLQIHVLGLHALAACGLLGLAACAGRPVPTVNSDADVDGPRTDGDGDGDIDPDIDAGPDADADGSPICDTQPIEITTEPPRVMILLDQSSSMVESSWGGHSHWSEVQAGLRALLLDPRHRRTVFGLDPFPDGDLEYLTRCDDDCCRQPQCLMDELDHCTELSAQCERSCEVDQPPWVPLAPAETSGTEILDYVDQALVPTVFGKTPLVKQLRWYAQDHSVTMPELYARDGAAYLVILSDGDDTCEGGGEASVAEIVTSLQQVTREILADWGIRTFALGFGDTEGDMARELDAIAENGGTAFRRFFPITGEGALLEAFDEISTSIVSCTYDVVQPDESADLEAVNFYFDGAVVGMDEACATGWRWVDEAHQQVEFCGDSCDRLKAGEVERIEARFGCSTIIW